ncbi:MAG: hypothetical protein QM765_49530 [Myxococcales bacterium]
MKKSPAPWTAAERKVFARLKTPLDVQGYLDGVVYSDDKFARSPRSVMRDRLANCFDGALFAAAALRQLGHKPLLLDMRPDPTLDDDHVVALFKQLGCWGSVGKSNFVGLRYREPIHRTVREVVISYFNDYYNSLGDKTLRSFAGPVDLTKVDALEWMTRDERLDEVGDYLNRARHVPIASPKQIRRFAKMDKRSLEAGLLGSRPTGLFKVG